MNALLPCPMYLGLRLPMRTRLAWSLEPSLGGRYLGTMLHSAVHGRLLVHLVIQARPCGAIQVDAVVPMQDYKVLFRERFPTAGPAIAFWRARYLELFGIDPLAESTL